MDKKLISIFTFGLFLIIAGAISKLFDWSNASLVMALGLIFELLAAILFIWKKITK